VTEAEKYEESQRPPPQCEKAAEDVLRQIEESYDTVAKAEGQDKEILLDRAKWHGIHAYRYEILDDGSVIALYSHEPGELKIKAFDDMEDASNWSPRDER